MPALIPVGPPTTILQNVQYALPARLTFLTSSVAVEQSLNGTTWSAVTGAETTGSNAGGVFLRCPSANALVVCKGY